jgi:hypothetical protein
MNPYEIPWSGYYENDERLGKIPIYKEFMKIRNIKNVRKDHVCEFCKGKISKGDSCQYWVGIDQFIDGKFYYYRVCKECTDNG